MGRLRQLIYLSLCMGLLLFCGCKSRKIAIHTVDSIAVSSSAKNTHIESTHVDTSKLNVTKKYDEHKTIVIKDSTGTTTTITPVPGTNSIIKPDGSFSGQASGIIINRRTSQSHTLVSDKDVFIGINSTKGRSDQKITDSYTINKDSTHVKSKVKNVESKPDYSWIWWIGGGLGIVLVLYLLYRKFKPF